MSRHKTPGRGGSAPAGDAPKVPTMIRLDPALKERTRELVGARGLSPKVEELLREWVARVEWEARAIEAGLSDD